MSFKVGDKVIPTRIIEDDNECGDATAHLFLIGTVAEIKGPYWGKDNHVVEFSDGERLCYTPEELEAA